MSETATAQSLVSVSRERDGVALIHLNRPPANSYDRAFLDDLNSAVDEVRWDGDVRGTVLVSDLAPRFFSAGADINNFKNSTQEQRVMTVLHAQEILLKIERTPKVFVAAISGHALGGGLEIALACDFRFAARLAKGPTLAIGNIKIATRLGADLPLDGALALEREAVWRLFMSDDAAEGLAAFGEKRQANWKGR